LKKILYVFDDINYPSGAQKVTLFQMETLKEIYDISVFSLVKPNSEISSLPFTFIGKQVWNRFELMGCSCASVIKSKQYSLGQKLFRLVYAIGIRLGFGEKQFDTQIHNLIGKELETFDTVIVVSEASKLRSMVSKLHHPRKIQWIHTDYELWSEFSEWTRVVTKKDGELYKNFDYVVALSEHSKKGLLKKLPELKSKIMVIPNLIDGKRILNMAQESGRIIPDKTKMNLITVGRLEKEKAFDRVLNICGRLKEQEKDFCWYIVGGGSLKEHLEKRIEKENLHENVKLIGELSNPYSLMKQCDCLVLVSDYEGTPVTIDEAGVLGLSVVAKNVGGIKEQVERSNWRHYELSNKESIKKLEEVF